MDVPGLGCRGTPAFGATTAECAPAGTQQRQQEGCCVLESCSMDGSPSAAAGLQVGSVRCLRAGVGAAAGGRQPCRRAAAGACGFHSLTIQFAQLLTSYFVVACVQQAGVPVVNSSTVWLARTACRLAGTWKPGRPWHLCPTCMLCVSLDTKPHTPPALRLCCVVAGWTVAHQHRLL